MWYIIAGAALLAFIEKTAILDAAGSMVELGTRWTFEPGDRLSMMDAVNECPPLILRHV